MDAPLPEATPQATPEPARRGTARRLVEQVKDRSGQLAELGMTKSTEYAESRKETVVGQLDAATGIVREFADSASERFGEPVAKMLHQGSDALDAVTRKLEAQSVEDSVEAARTAIVRYPGIALAVVSVAGFLAGRIVKAGLSQPGARRSPSNDSSVTEVAA